jgi:subtilisin family serine protease
MSGVMREIGLGGDLPHPRDLSGRGVTVAVLDSGIDARHPFLSVAAAVSTCPEPRETPGRHGTYCAGIIACRDPERPGVAPGVRLLDVKVARATGWTSPGWLAQGIDAAMNLGADVLSISLGLNLLPASLADGHGWVCPDGRCVLCRAVDHGVACGAVVVAAAGNEHLRALALAQRGEALPAGAEVLCPARARGALTVGALDRAHLRRLYATSSHGAGKPDLVAPGAAVTSTVPVPARWSPARPFELFGAGSGTSVAAAVVAGAVALLIESRRAAGLACSPADIRRELLAEHVRPIALPECPPEALGAGALSLSTLRSPFQPDGRLPLRHLSPGDPHAESCP